MVESIAGLKAQLAAERGANEQLQATVNMLLAQSARLAEENAELKGRLGNEQHD